MEASSQDDAPAITTPETCTEPTKTSSFTVDPTREKENPSENTTPKSPITSPTLRRVLGGLENIILTPLSKVRNSAKNKEAKPQHESRSRRALPTDDHPDKSTSEKCNSTHETLYTSLVDDLNDLKSLVFSNKVTMDNQQKCINDLTANVQNRKKEVEKQARQIQDLNTELERQRNISKDLAQTISSQKADQEAIQAQLTLLLNQPQSVGTTASRVCRNSQQDDSRIQRLYAEVVSGLHVQHPNSSPATQIPKPSDSEAPTTANTQPRAPTAAISQPPVTTDTQPAPATPPTPERVVPDKQTPVTPAPQTSGNVKDRSLYKRDGIHLIPDAGGVKLMVADVKRTLRHHQEAMDSRQRTKPARGPQRMPNIQPYMQPGQHPHPTGTLHGTRRRCTRGTQHVHQAARGPTGTTHGTNSRLWRSCYIC
uniref:Uncharacterized protein n=1 Tax=Branchiostoma floridae TaxID=7739 RepID=C3ZFT3_BRAFL|eukprot:XP_002592560.1 hypothetical protein BRAFLDRAFT_68882 [Branchiostoma floridae]